MDIHLNNDDYTFKYRVCGIIIENGHALVMGNGQYDYFYAVGGKVMMGETAEEAIVREVWEETGVAYKVQRLVFIHESFFMRNNKQSHELAFYFLMKPQGKGLFSYQNGEEFLKWIPVEEYERHQIYPEFLRGRLSNLPMVAERVVTRS